jgi:hypothetical protein
VRDHGPGDLFGELEVLESSRRLLQARSFGRSTVYLLPQKVLVSFLGSQPAVEERLRALSVYRRTMRLHLMLAPSTRRDPRIRLDRNVRLTPELGESIWVRLEDLSYGGACLSGAPDSWLPGELVSFALGVDSRPQLLRLQAQVRWRSRDLVGLVFASNPDSKRRHRQIERALPVLLSSR